MKNFKKILSIAMCLCLCLPNLKGFAVSTAVSGATVSMDSVRQLPEGENLLSGKIPLRVDYTPGGRSFVERKDMPENTNMTDGDLKSEWLDSKLTYADYNDGDPIIYSNGEARCLITFFLNKASDISKMCLINHSNDCLKTGEYEIYASETLRELYWEENKVVYVENDEAMDRQIVDCNVKGAVFVGIKIIYPAQVGSTDPLLEVKSGGNNHYPRICEFGIYGKEVGESDYPVFRNDCDKTIVSEASPATEGIDITTNFLLGKEPQVSFYKNGTTTKITPSDKVSLTDGHTVIKDGVSTDWRVSAVKFANREQNGCVTILGGDNYYVDILLDAGSQKELGLFYIKHHTTEALRTMRYKIFASSNESNLTSSSSLIADCYNHNGSLEQYFIVPNGQTVKARYYTIRIYESCYDYSGFQLKAVQDKNEIVNAYTRLLEVAAYTPDTISAILELEGIDKVDSNVYGYIKPGTKVKSIHNAFSGRGDVRVENAQGNIKAPSDALDFGDKVVADTYYGKDAEATFKFCGDLNNSDSFTVSDVRRWLKAIVDENYDINLVDLNGDKAANITDLLILVDAIVGKTDSIVDNSPAPVHGPKYGAEVGDKYEVMVDTSVILNENFRSFGANQFTSTLIKEGMGLEKAEYEPGKFRQEGYPGFNLVYHELNKKRIASMKPTVSRIWFQPDWIVTDTLGDFGYQNYQDNWQEDPDYLNYKNEIYNFENEKMQAFYDYVEMLAEYGSTIEINFGWKTSARIQYWFNDPHCSNFEVGAPRDLEAFGNAAAALVKYLNEVKGYDFVEALTFYNEPNIGDFERDVEGDMDERMYWSQLVHAVDAALKRKGIRDMVEIWGAEVSGMANDTTKDWVRYQLENTASSVDQWTGHNYYKFSATSTNYSTNFDTLLYYAELTDRNMMVTEMYGASTNDVVKKWYNWGDSFTGYYIAVSNAGLNGLLAWSIVGGYLPEPLYMELSTNDSAAWYVPHTEKSANTVNRIFYEESLFTNYIPDGSKVLYTGWIGSDIRAASYMLPDGNITIVVENNGINNNAVLAKGTGKEKEITISLSDGIDRTFKRISYFADSQEINANATVNRADKTIETEDGTFSDTLGEHYSVHIYTTAPLVKQIEMKEVFLHTVPGQKVQIVGEMLDCVTTDEIVYSISEFTSYEAGTIDQKGLYTPAASAKSGDMVAIRATLKSDPKVFGVSIIYID